MLGPDHLGTVIEAALAMVSVLKASFKRWRKYIGARSTSWRRYLNPITPSPSTPFSSNKGNLKKPNRCIDER